MSHMSASHILVSREFEAKDILKKLNEGVPFEKLAADFSMCPSAKKGGHLGEFPKGKMVPTFEQAVLKLKAGEVSGIVRTSFGYHIIKRHK